MIERRYVRVRNDFPPGHVRTPSYLKGKVGWIERELGSFGNPEELAYRHPGTPTPLLRVRFNMCDVWGDAALHNDTIDAEIYAHWLEDAETADHAS